MRFSFKCNLTTFENCRDLPLLHELYPSSNYTLCSNYFKGSSHFPTLRSCCFGGSESVGFLRLILRCLWLCLEGFSHTCASISISSGHWHLLSSLKALLEQDVFHRSLMACCLEVVLFAYSSPRTFPWIIEVLDLRPFYFYKVKTYCLNLHWKWHVTGLAVWGWCSPSSHVGEKQMLMCALAILNSACP